jgi:hypothetical protein
MSEIEIKIEEMPEKKPRKKWTAQNPRKKREEKIRKPSKYEDGLPFDDIRYKYNRTYYEKNREKMLQKMKEKYQNLLAQIMQWLFQMVQLLWI